MRYPDNCIRGISDHNCVRKIEDHFVALRGLFTFRNNPERDDGWDEGSINWEDDDKARDFTLDQTKDDAEGERKFQFKVGIAILPCDELKSVKKKYGYSSFGYERDDKPSNRYHGNLLLKNDLDSGLKDMIRSMLAMGISEIVLRNDS